MESIVEPSCALPKISPPARRTHLLSRPRLLDFLEQHLDRKLILVSAPAGYGKTSLLVDLAATTSVPVAWYSLDPGDADPRVFAECLVSSLRRLFPDGFPQTTARLASAQFPRDLDRFTIALVNEISALSDYFVLVLDDLHSVDGTPTVNALLETLLRWLPENAHLILASRVVPTQMPLLRMAARQEIASLSAADLRFREDELVALAQQNHWANLDPARLQALVDFADGWIAGILLAGQEDSCALQWGVCGALPAQRTTPYGRSIEPRPFLHDERHIFDYFAAEVLAREAPAVQDFLMQTAVLDELTRDTTQALWGAEALQRLAELETRNLFIAHVDDGTSASGCLGQPINDVPSSNATPHASRTAGSSIAWRYHPLFRHFLLGRFRKIAPAEERAWQKRAAEHFEETKQPDLAIRHYRASERTDLAARAMDRAADAMMKRGRFQTLAEWIDSLPPEALLQFPSLLVQRGMIYHRDGQRELGEALLVQAEGICRSRGDERGHVRALVARADTYSTMGRLRESVEMLEESLQLALPKDGRDATPEDILCQARIRNPLGVAFGRLGNLARGRQELEEALRLLLTLADPPPGELATVHHNLGTILTAQASAAGEAHYRTAQRLYPVGECSRMRLLTANNLGVLYYQRGDLARARTALEPACAEALREGDLYAYSTLGASLADVCRDQGDLGAATADYREALASARKIQYASIVVYVLTALAELDCRRGSFAAAEDAIVQAAAITRWEDSRTDEWAVRLATGILRRGQGDWAASSLEFYAATDLARSIGAKRELARALLESAVNDLRRDDRILFRERMEEVARLAQGLAETQMLVCSAHSTRTAIDTAIQNGIGSDLYQAVERQMPSTRESGSTRVELIAEPPLKVQAFGDGAVWVAGELVHWEASLARELFFFVLSEKAGLRKEKILDALWPELSSAEAHKNFYPTVSRVRHAIPRTYFFRDDHDRYRVRREGLVYDVEEFERALAESAKPKQAPAQQVESLRAAIALYRGDYLADSYREWALSLQRHLEQSFLRALRCLAQLEERLGETTTALATWERLWRADEFDEDAVRAVMRLRAASGNLRGAADAYQSLVRELQDGLGSAPQPKTVALYRQITNTATVAGALASLTRVAVWLLPFAHHLGCVFKV